MNGNNTGAATSSQNSSNGPSSTSQINNNNSSANTNVTGGSAPNTGNSTSASSHHQQHQHQRLSSTSSPHTSNSKLSLKKSLNNEVEKINTSIGSLSNQGGFRSGGNKDQRIKEKEKESGGGSGGNQQNARKKDNKNRDLSNQSHRSGGLTNNHVNHHQQHQSSNSVENSKLGFPSNTSLSSVPGIVSPTPAVPAQPQVFHESKTVQTDQKVKKEKPKPVKKEERLSPFKSTDPKDMDTVTAFQEQDDWNKVEMMCELLYLLSPTDLRLVLNCIEGAIRCYTNQMRPVETTSNSENPTVALPQFICSPPHQPLPAFPNVSDTTAHNLRSLANVLVGPPVTGLPPLMTPVPNLLIPAEQNCNQPSSSTTPSSSISTANKETANVVVSNQAGGSTSSSEGQSQDSLKTAQKATTPEPESSHSHSGNPPRPATSTMQNSTPQVPQEPELFLKAVRDITSYLYTMMSMCASTNRKSAAKISDYVKGVLLREKNQVIERIPNELDKIDVLQDIGKIISAMTHHPAVTLDDKMSYSNMRDGIRSEIEGFFRQYYSKESERKHDEITSTDGVGDTEDTEDSDEYEEDEFELVRRFGAIDLHSRSLGYLPHTSSTSMPGTFFITRFIGRQVEKSDNLFSLEIHWSDGDRTFAQRSRDQLKALQHRLLDEFGQQRSEKHNHNRGMSSSFSSFDEDNKKLSTSNSTMETSFAPGGERIVPRLSRDATPSQYVQYINELSDLPARMMLSSVICEEFNGTRSRTEDESRASSDGLIFSRWKNPRAKSPIRFYDRDSGRIPDTVEYPVNIQPFSYSNTPQSHQQILYPSCSNCGGQHAIKVCDKSTLLDKKDPKIRLDPEGIPPNPSALLGGATTSPFFTPLHPQIPHHMFIDTPPGMLASNHYNHHQQQLMQNTLFHNGGQFRPNGPPYEGHVPVMFVPQNGMSNSSAGNNPNGGSNNQNANF
ncbi:CBN-GLS-1 protein [Caenorhabditis brenneri]|uniref:CBN-GLS-1 protein n=1 Tax=Caenorhabditis brenneri TaxID=135651 RepID=G0NUX6_CAEBE|nr:CBN-GLS-1 protein [Caenorhabditis brenneri]